jgi:hypothetical protein
MEVAEVGAWILGRYLGISRYLHINIQIQTTLQKNSKSWCFGLPDPGGSSAVLRGLNNEARPRASSPPTGTIRIAYSIPREAYKII